MTQKPSAATLARYFPSVTTADKIASSGSSPQATPIAPKAKERWSKEKAHAFDLMAPSALYILATEGLISATEWNLDGSPRKVFGGNRRCWPARIGVTTSRRDTITPLYNKGPCFEVAVQGTVWLPGASEAGSDASQLALRVIDWLALQEEEAGTPKLYAGFHDLVAAFNLDEFAEAEGERHPIRRLELEVRLLARRFGLVAWDEDGLSLFLDRALKAAHIKGIDILDHRGRKIMHTGFQRLVDRMVEQEAQRQFPGRG